MIEMRIESSETLSSATMKNQRYQRTLKPCILEFFLVALAGWLGIACDEGHEGDEQIRKIKPVVERAALLDNEAIGGMEEPSAWSTTTSGAVLAQSSIHSQGSYSLSVHPSNSNGYTPIKSVDMSTLSTVSPTLAVDVMLPTYQPNPYWLGIMQAYIDCPSRSIHNQFLGQVELTGKLLDVWNTVNFTLTNNWITGLLQSGYTDLTITVVLNVQVPTTEIYLIDNLRFLPVASDGCAGRPNGTSCTDDSACTVGDSCQSGTCLSGDAVICAAIDQCHDRGACDPGTGICSNPASPDGTTCDDGNLCTENDSCISGACTNGVEIVCAAIDQCHDQGACDPGTGMCSNPASPDGTTCDDGNLCTENDSCISGACVSGPETICATGDQCHDQGVCDPETGICSNSPKPDKTACSTGKLCVTDESCLGGVCSGGRNQSCGVACGNNGLCDDNGSCVSVAEKTICGDGANPKPNEVVVWEDPGFTGMCTTLAEGKYPNGSSFPPVHNDSILSLKVGCGVRALLYKDAASPNFGSFVATYEAGSRHDINANEKIFKLGPGVRSVFGVPQTSAIIVAPEDGRRVAYSFLGDYPHDTDEVPFSSSAQGLCHSDSHWFFTNKKSLFKISLNQNLDSPAVEWSATLPPSPSGWDFSGPTPINLHKKYCANYEYLQEPLPDPFLLAGCNHMGDPDYSRAHNLVFIPLEGCCIGSEVGEKIAVYEPNTQTFVGASELSDQQQGSGWLAIDPRDGETHLWTSNSGLKDTDEQGVHIYSIDWNVLDLAGGDDPVTDFLDIDYSIQPPVLKDINAGQLHVDYMQGGVFTPDGKILYLSNSKTGTHGILAFNPETGMVIASSGDNYGPFNYQRGGIDQEEEGLDYLDQLEYYEEHNGAVLPGAGELHAIMSFAFGDDSGLYDSSVSIKHYTAWPENYCRTVPKEDEVTIWSDSNFKGTCRTLQIGDYPSYRWMYPMMTDWPSSIRVGAKVKATIFDDDNYGGNNPKTILGGVVDACDPRDSRTPGQISNLDTCGWNERVSSIKVASVPAQ